MAGRKGQVVDACARTPTAPIADSLSLRAAETIGADGVGRDGGQVPNRRATLIRTRCVFVAAAAVLGRVGLEPTADG